jgi:hypothetical protein
MGISTCYPNRLNLGFYPGQSHLGFGPRRASHIESTATNRCSRVPYGDLMAGPKWDYLRLLAKQEARAGVVPAVHNVKIGGEDLTVGILEEFTYVRRRLHLNGIQATNIRCQPRRESNR